MRENIDTRLCTVDEFEGLSKLPGVRARRSRFYPAIGNLQINDKVVSNRRLSQFFADMPSYDRIVFFKLGGCATTDDYGIPAIDIEIPQIVLSQIGYSTICRRKGISQRPGRSSTLPRLCPPDQYLV